ncbi:MAG TPA: RDD family protein [Candidatus Micrarchaeaceae archaeon]|nr:RDD family protein [Candidatus Micrarchaeaceae archaeon]
MQYAAPQYQGRQPTYAGFWIRLVARLVDGLIIGIPFGIVFGVFLVAGGVFENANGNGPSSQGSQNAAAAAAFGGAFLLLYLLVFVVQIGYWIYFWGSSGATLGMRLLRLRVVDANTGGPIGYARATVRFLMSIVNTWACYVGWIWVAFDPRKQGWHDKVANSVVLQY